MITALFRRTQLRKATCSIIAGLVLLFGSTISSRAECAADSLNVSRTSSELVWFNTEDGSRFINHSQSQVATLHGNKDLSLAVLARRFDSTLRIFQFSPYERNPFYTILTIHAP